MRKRDREPVRPEDAPIHRFVFSSDELEQGRLAGSVLTHQRHLHALLKRKARLGDDRVVVSVVKRDVFKAEDRFLRSVRTCHSLPILADLWRICYVVRCGHPAKQQGRRFPCARFSNAILSLLSRVSSFTPEVIQQIHSLRASGVMSFQAAKAACEERSAFRT